jgi:hypothetical protein
MMQKQVQAQKKTYVEEEQDLDEQEREKIRKLIRYLMKKGIIATYSYHCNRCNHVWFPTDFDPVLSSATSGGFNLIHRTPPKACARCKNRYWNSPPKRKTRSSSPETTDFGRHKLRSMMGSDKMESFGHDMITAQRMRADYRETKKRMDRDDKEIKKLKELAKKWGLNIK